MVDTDAITRYTLEVMNWKNICTGYATRLRSYYMNFLSQRDDALPPSPPSFPAGMSREAISISINLGITPILAEEQNPIICNNQNNSSANLSSRKETPQVAPAQGNMHPPGMRQQMHLNRNLTLPEILTHTSFLPRSSVSVHSQSQVMNVREPLIANAMLALPNSSAEVAPAIAWLQNNQSSLCDRETPSGQRELKNHQTQEMKSTMTDTSVTSEEQIESDVSVDAGVMKENTVGEKMNLSSNSAPESKKRSDQSNLKPPKRFKSAYNYFFMYERELTLRNLDGNRGKQSSSENETFGEETSNQGTDVPHRYKEVAEILKGRTNTYARRKHRKSHGKIGFKELSKHVANRWSEIDSKSKGFFQKLASDDLARYKIEVEKYKKIKMLENESKLKENHCVDSSPSKISLAPITTPVACVNSRKKGEKTVDRHQSKRGLENTHMASERDYPELFQNVGRKVRKLEAKLTSRKEDQNQVTPVLHASASPQKSQNLFTRRGNQEIPLQVPSNSIINISLQGDNIVYPSIRDDNPRRLSVFPAAAHKAN